MKPSLIIKLIYLRRFFNHFIFFWAIDKIFFLERGASPFEISILLGLWSVHALIFEVPSGAIADRWSRKWLLVISSLFHSAAYFVWIFSSGFWLFLLGYMLRGTGGVLASGTKEAFLYDHLKADGKEKQFEKSTGRIWVITTISFLITALFAGTLADKFSFTLVLVLSIVSNLISGVIALFIPDTPPSRSTEEVSYWKFIGQAFKKALKQPVLLQALLYASLVLTVFEVLDEYDQLYVDSIGLPLKLFGIWWLIRLGFEGIAGLVAHRFKRFNILKLLNSFAGINFVILLLAAFTESFIILPLLGLMFGLFSIAKILNVGVIQRHIHSHERATITSISTFLGETVGIVAGLIFGYLANIYNPQIGVFVFAALIVIYFATQTVFVRKRARLIFAKMNK